MSTAYVRYPATGGGSSLAIGETVTDGTPLSVLFIDGTGALAEAANFNYDDTDHQLTAGLFSVRNDGIGGSILRSGSLDFLQLNSVVQFTRSAIAGTGAESMGCDASSVYPFVNLAADRTLLGYAPGDAIPAIIHGAIQVKAGMPLTLSADGVKMPSFTTTQKNALTASAGLVVFDSTLGKLCVYTGAAWETITSV